MEKICPGDATAMRPRIPLMNAMVFGNRVAPYHPLDGVEAVLRAVLGQDFALRFTEDLGLLVDGLADCRLVVAYADTWQQALDAAQVGGLLGFVERGGGLLSVHNGICWSLHPEFRQMIGAAFTGHPEQAVLPYRLSGSHPIVEGLADFELFEEPYRYDFGAGLTAEVFLHYAHEGRQWPAGWALMQGAGRVVSLQPGHRAAAFENPGYAALLRRSARWSAGGLGLSR